MLKQIRRTLLATSMLATTLVVGTTLNPASAGAELSSQPTTTWGVSGLRADTQTNALKSEIFAMETVDNTLYVAGRFTQVTNGVSSQDQGSLAAFDATTGEWIDTFRPTLDGAVYTLAASSDGSQLFVGGDFQTTNGTSTGGLIALDPTTGLIDDTWSGRIRGYNVVRDLDISDGWLYAGGGFTSIADANNSKAIARLGRFSLSDGSIDVSWRPDIAGGSVYGLDISETAGRIYIAGTFKTVDASVVSNGFASLDLDDAEGTENMADLAINTTRTDLHYSFDVLAANGLVWVAGSQHSLQVLNEETLELETFYLSRHHGDFQDLILIDNVIYAGCHCDQKTDIARAEGIIWWGDPPEGVENAEVLEAGANSWVSAFDATTGLRDASFVPNIEAGGAGVWALADAPQDCLWIGGAITSASGETQYGMTRLCEGVDIDVVDHQRPSVPGMPVESVNASGSTVLSWRASTDNVAVATYRIYDADTREVVATSTTTSATLTELAAGSLNVFAKAVDASGNESWRSGIRSITVREVDTERPSVPGKPRIVIGGADLISLTWYSSTDNVGVAAYRIYDADTKELLVEITEASISVSEFEVDLGTIRIYAKAADAAGNESWRSGILTLELP